MTPGFFDEYNESLQLKQKQMNQLYLVLRELESKTETGMGYDAESDFSYLCINADGEQCIIHEVYISHSPKDSKELVNDGNLLSWHLRIQPSDPEQQAGQKEQFIKNSNRLIRPPLAVRLRTQK